jgi:hypothetical protein
LGSSLPLTLVADSRAGSACGSTSAARRTSFAWISSLGLRLRQRGGRGRGTGETMLGGR